jgi:hypothetical protein
VLIAGARSAAAVACRRGAFSQRLDGRATAVIAAMACARRTKRTRWAKDIPALVARAHASVAVSIKAVGCSRPARAGATTARVPRARLRDSSPHPPQHDATNTAPSRQLNRVSLPHSQRPRTCESPVGSSQGCVEAFYSTIGRAGTRMRSGSKTTTLPAARYIWVRSWRRGHAVLHAGSRCGSTL